MKVFNRITELGKVIRFGLGLLVAWIGLDWVDSLRYEWEERKRTEIIFNSQIDLELNSSGTLIS